MISRILRYRYLPLASALSLFATPAVAEEAADSAADSLAAEAPSGQILVTATCTSTAVSRVQISFSAYDQKTMEAPGLCRT